MIHSLNPSVRAERAQLIQDLPEILQRYISYNGAVFIEQHTRLYDVFRHAATEGRSAIVIMHIPDYGPATKPQSIASDREDVLRILHAML